MQFSAGVAAVVASTDTPSDTPIDDQQAWWIFPLALAAAALYIWGRRWWDRQDRGRIPAKWWPVGLNSELPTGARGETGAGLADRGLPLPDLPRPLLSFELSFLARTRWESDLLALGFMELGARRILLITDDNVTLLAQQHPSGLPPLLDHLLEACERELGDPPGQRSRTASHIGTSLRGGLFGEQDRIARWIAEPLVELGLMKQVEISRNGLDDTDWRPTPTGHAIVAWAERIVADTDPTALAELARTDPQEAYAQLTKVPPALLVLMRPLHPVARDVAKQVRTLGMQDIQVDGLYLAGLTEPEVVLGRTDDNYS